jgi:hypothetical protein
MSAFGGGLSRASNQDGFVDTGSLQKSYAAPTTAIARPISAPQPAPRLLSVTCPALIPYSQDSDNVEREIETIEREISGCPGMTSSRM